MVHRRVKAVKHLPCRTSSFSSASEAIFSGSVWLICGVADQEKTKKKWMVSPSVCTNSVEFTVLFLQKKCY